MPVPVPIAKRESTQAIAFRSCLRRVGLEGSATRTERDVVPGSLKAVRPPEDRAVSRMLRDTWGAEFAVDPDAARGAVRLLAEMECVFPCPRSATVVANLEHALAAGFVHREDSIVHNSIVTFVAGSIIDVRSGSPSLPSGGSS